MSNVLSLRLVLRRRLVLPPCGPGAVSVPSLSRALCWGPAPPSVASTARLAEAVTSSALFSQVLSTAGSSSSEDGLVSSFLFYLCGIGTFSFFFAVPFLPLVEFTKRGKTTVSDRLCPVRNLLLSEVNESSEQVPLENWNVIYSGSFDQ